MFPELDPRSLIYLAGMLSLLSTIILFVLRSSFPETIHGLMHWSTGCLAMIVASVLYGLTGHVPLLMSMVAANVLLVGGVMLISLGFASFLDRPVSLRLPLAALMLATCAFLWYTYVDPHYPARSMVVGSINSAVFLSSAALLFRHAWDSPSARFTGAVFLTIGLISGARFFILLSEADVPRDVLATSASQKFYLAALGFSIVAITLGAIMMANEKLRKELEFIASHDTLSGAYTRGAFIELLEKEMARVRRDGRPLALLMCDLDHFKSINDRHGHIAGDHVIADFAHRTMSLLRRQDCLGRYGGEEFIVLLPDTDLKAAATVAERIRAMVAESRLEGLPPYTVSIGVNSTADGKIDVDALLADTDKALYEAKRNGRNQVVAMSEAATVASAG